MTRSDHLKVLLVAGARPNFMKIAPIIRALRAGGHEAILVHTGQHYDEAMSDAFFRDLDIPEPNHHLGVGTGTHAVQTAKIMELFEPVLMAVDGSNELRAFVEQLGLPTRFVQYPGTYREHFDAPGRYADILLQHGARPVTTRELGTLLKAKRGMM